MRSTGGIADWNATAPTVMANTSAPGSSDSLYREEIYRVVLVLEEVDDSASFNHVLNVGQRQHVSTAV